MAVSQHAVPLAELSAKIGSVWARCGGDHEALSLNQVCKYPLLSTIQERVSLY